MSIFGNIMSAIFGHAAKAQLAPAEASAAGGSGASGSSTSSAAPSVSPLSQVDVESVLVQLASRNKEKLDWRKSIVDLMKLLDLDSSLPARKELAKELRYTGDTNDSAAMNIWLHKQVMIKLADNGGKVPAELRS
ncbi:MAG: DUF3597 domain-containing protein [Xanthobacteraceae bacterium]